MSVVADPRRSRRAATLLASGLLLVSVLIPIAALAARGSQRAVEGPYGQLAAQIATGELVAGSRAGQTFILDQVGLYRIDVYLGNYQRQNKGPLVLRIKAAPFVAGDLATATADASQLQADGFVAFEFAPLDEPAGRHICFWLEAPQAQTGNAVTVMGATSDAYPGGMALFDKLPANHGVNDLAFRLYYRTGTAASLAALLVRQAAGRPSIFGLPQLYLALFVAYVLGLAVLLLLLVNRMRL